MSLPESLQLSEVETDAMSLIRQIEEHPSEEFSDEFVQELLTCAVKLYSARELTDASPPAVDPAKVTVTEVARTVGPVLDAVQLELFELTMWRGLRA